jgi:hypothetical protein
LEEQACAHALKVGLPDVEYDPRNYKPPGSFTAIEGTTIGQSPIPQPPPVVASEPKPPAMERVTVHVGAGSTLSQEIELPVAATRVRPSKQRGAAA